LLLALLPFAYAATPAPTIPTPKPTITPAPKSLCKYQDSDNGPFALDCLQALFLDRCVARSPAYPTEDSVSDLGDKAEYNSLTWGEVKSKMAAVSDEDCRPATPAPVTPPAEVVVTKTPTVKPTKPPTHLRPPLG